MVVEKHVFAQVNEAVFTTALPNGLSIYVMPKQGFSKKYAFFATNYGGADTRFQDGEIQRDTPAGIAHFLEHKLFDTKDGNALADLAANGAQPNAFTSADLTAYYFECTEKFWENLTILLQFVSEPYFTKESVEKEQGIIGQEIDMVLDRPEWILYYNFLKSLYENHPAKDTIIGTKESIAEITAETLYDLHRVFYRPSNMVLCVVGDVDPTRVAEEAARALPGEYHDRPIKNHGAPETKAVIAPRTECNMAVSQPMFMVGTRVSAGARGKEFLRNGLVGSLAVKYLAGKTSPLYLRLYDQGLVSNDFSCDFAAYDSYAFTEFSGESNDPDAVVAALKAEILSVQQGGVDPVRFARLKKGMSGKLLQGLDHAENICYDQTLCHFQGAYAYDRFAVMHAITADDVRSFITQNLQPDHFALSIVRPG